MSEKCTMAPAACSCSLLYFMRAVLEGKCRDNVKSFNSNRFGNQKVSSSPIWHLLNCWLKRYQGAKPMQCPIMLQRYKELIHTRYYYRFSFPHCNWLQLLPASCALLLPCFSSFVLFAKLRLNFCSTIVDNFICIGLIFATWALCEWMECSFISFVNKLLYVIYVTIC